MTPNVPVQIAHSRLDDVIPFARGVALQNDWTARGGSVSFVAGSLPGHVGGYPGAYLSALTFFSSHR